MRHGLPLFALWVLLIGGGGVLPAAAQSEGASLLQGAVRDAATGEALAGANVLVESADGAVRRGQAAGADGTYRFDDLPAGTYTVTASYLGYETSENEVTLAPDQERRLDLDLRRRDVEVGTITVTGEQAEQHAARDLGAARITTAQIKRLPAVLEPDVFRALQLLPGVKAASDFSSGLYIRGGSPDQTLILLDQTTVYNPTHFFGFFSTFNPDALDEVQLYRGGFPASYGGRLGAVVDLKTKTGSRTETKGTASLGLLASRAMVEGPFRTDSSGARGTWMIAARRSTLEPLLYGLRSQGVEGVPEGFHFYDLNGKATVEASRRDRLSLTAYAGADALDFAFLDDARVVATYGNQIASLNWQHLFSDRAFADLRLSASRYFSEPTFEIAGSTFQRTNTLRDLSAQGDAEVRLGERHALQGGGRGGLLRVNLRRTLDEQTVFSPRLGTGYVTGYLQDTYRPGERWQVTGGLRASYYTSGSFFRLGPRLSVEYRPTGGLRLQAGYGRYNQFLTLITSELFSGVDTWLTTGEGVSPSYGDQFVAGVKADLGRSFTLDVEGYYRTMRDLFQVDPYLFDAAGLDYEDAFLFGEGAARGLEVKLERTEGRLSGFLAYTLAQTRRRLPFLNLGATPIGLVNAQNALGGAYPPKYDRRHDLKLVLNYDLADRWRATGVFTLASGQAYTEPKEQYKLIDYPLAGTPRDVLVSPFNAERLPPYHRLDLGVRRLGQVFGLDYELQLQVVNAYGRRNVWFYFFEFEDDNTITREEIPQIPVPLPNVSLTVDF